MHQVARAGCRLVWVAVIVATTLSATAADDAKVIYYDVVGNTAHALRLQLDAEGPVGKDGKRFDGHTRWYVSWKYHYRPTASGCRFTDVKVSVEGTITLPRWADPGHAPPALVQKWDHYLAALRVHEEGHFAHGRNAAREIQALARSFHATGDCPRFAATFNQQARAIITRYAAMDAMYDRNTGHGRSQGAVFP